MPQNSTPVFNALDGQESAKLIANSLTQALIGKSFKKKLATEISKEFHRQFASHADFRPNLTYRSFRWETRFEYQFGANTSTDCVWKVAVKFEWSTQDIEDFGVEGTRIYALEGQSGFIPLFDVPSWQVIEDKGSSARAPDRDRDKLNLKKPKATQTAGGIVDWPKTQ